MRDEDFKNKLTEVAEWFIPLDIDQPFTTKKQGYRGRPKASDTSTALPVVGTNPTFGPVISKFKHCEKSCEDCGKVIDTQHVIEAKMYFTGYARHWRRRCVNCGLYMDPRTGQYTLKGTETSHAFNSYLRNKSKQTTEG